ncbi:hypothetical protein QJS10_CPB12g00764 [Acorus calamus]|uniref:Uncharacterized protein n=1 Tax=Acorus calamus TaxID=4465 RepID=A0AAV9DNZ7_ACOCL|nr:hypothetical protein QJS10_CPB12g00764 [Acorus calamus]
MDSPPKNSNGENGIDDHGRRPPKKPKFVAPINHFEIATEFAHHESSVARINNGSFGSCLSSTLSTRAIKDLINSDDIEEVSIVDNATTAAAIVRRWSWGPGLATVMGVSPLNLPQIS